MRQKLADNGIFLLRVTVSFMMLSHGIPKALGYEELVQTFPDPLNIGTEMSAILIIAAEVGCSVLLLLGLFGRVAAAVLFIAMIVAAFVHHFHDPWSTKELSSLYAAVFACLALTGPGSTSIDGWVSKRLFEAKGRGAPTPHRAEPGAQP